ncbi:ABC transporter permease [Oryzibacter oryziterrae]|uniref:ABC transporter permease n=1 Tax=Oryzibacter oryziterrae TaxID=2766474 RepID=UPI001F2C325A|nr:ABC transporter permease [Oryzibacter oryziterrae]
MPSTAYLMRRQEPGRLRTALSYSIGLIIGLALSAAILVAVGVPAGDLVDEFLVETFLTSDGLAQTVTAAGPLILVGLSSALAMRIRFWNIGVEGQMWFGAIAGTFVALNHIGPAALRLPLGLALAFAAGALFIWPCLVLKRRFGISEVISTLLASNMAFLLVQHLLFGVWRDPANSFPITVEFPPESQFAALGWGQTHTGVILSLVAAVVAWFLLERSPVGYYADAVGHNPAAATETGLPVKAIVLGMTLASGGLSGLAGALVLSGTEHRLSQALGNGYLFSAIVIAYLARSKPTWVVVASIALAAIYTAGNVLKVFYSVSEAVIVLAQGTVLMSILIAQFFSHYSIHFSENTRS